MDNGDTGYFDKYDLSHCINNEDGKHCGRCADINRQKDVDDLVKKALNEEKEKSYNIEDIRGL